ncbi:maleylpyruvate isomerase family mycothiol-dependent enzyme [Amycolatopsis nalaikhensis]|uniref:Maleylpyruvate isomerase family mycothiol-dependent enzyme n=1 Tax=Amycolatopsis nalaikhensis TaxID=715472 RepID=A0ABY8X8U5_9PSEU|nr:maleylpyruvate isomerase family mycothiol-dependent enzyme [Amycolatopsis sp. 2-2]WIV52737.1 maleylpyruvate isomerase family mycothiol-dependent enzyme [Amycolatopsis sp. 2-2]
MQDVHADLAADAETLAALIRDHEGSVMLPAGRAITGYLAELTVVARRVVLGVEGEESASAPRITNSGMLGDAVLAWLSEHRKATELLATAEADVPWPGGAMRPSAVAAAVLTALFARGQDIADVLGVRLPRTDSVGHVAYYGVRTRDEVYAGHGEPPAARFRYELVAPSGERWEFGPADAPDRISGPAVDFCLLFTGRRAAADLAVTAAGDEAVRWVELVPSRRNPLWTSEVD